MEGFSYNLLMDTSLIPSDSFSSDISEIVFSSDFDSTIVEFYFRGDAGDLLGYGPAASGVTVRKSWSGEFIADAEKLGIRVTRI